MATISVLKEQRTTQTPLFLVECELVSGSVERWSTHSVTVEGSSYEGRIIRHNLFEIRAEADDGVDGVPKISLTLVNTDSYCSQIERNTGWKGAKVTVRFVFYDLKNGAAASEQSVIFKGIANPPDEITESSMRLTVSNRMNLQRLLLPQVRIQRRCTWKFPTTADQRAEAVNGADEGKYSPFYACGYSPNTTGGVGNLNGTECYTTCDYSRTSCEARGMFNKDSAGNNTRRFGGIEYVPSTILVRSYGDKSYHLSAVTENESRYNDCVPVVYGTAWYKPPIVFARNDGNLTRFEVLLGMGRVYGVLKVLVKDYEIAAGVDGTDMTSTGWYKLFNAGERTGEFNYDFTDSNGNPSGDPYGSMAVLSVVVPNSINDGDTLPTIEVLLQGMLLPRYDAGGNALGESFSNNPSWAMLDILRRIGWSLDEIDLPSFAEAAAFCEEMIDGQDIYGNALQIPRFQCNAVLRSRKCAADVIRGIRTGSRLQLRLGTDGLLRLRVENSLKLQQPTKPDGSNSVETLNDGWPCYEFDDGTSGFGGILRNSSGEPSISLSARNTADTPNRYSVEFQDALNEYQQDSLSLVDVDDAVRVRQEISATLQATGIPNFHQAARIIQLQLDKSVRGNLYVEFDTSVRGVHLKPGDIITVTYLREGLERQPFRITGITPGQNYGTATIEAQIHDDAWYTDELGSTTGTGGRRRAGSEVGIPRPLVGSVLDENGEAQFEVTESTSDDSEGQSTVTLTAGFIAPAKPVSTDLSIPMLDLSPLADDNTGTLAGDQTLYYAVSALGADGAESALSFVVTAVIPPGTATNSVRLTGLRFGPEATGFCAYRGTNPSLLFLIASSSELASEFTDSGLTKQLVSPPDESYDHANFYWRRELVPEAPATVHSTETIGNDTLQMTENAYRGMTVRIVRGAGSGQERPVASNSATVLTVSSAWSVEPDTSSYFVVAESSWHTGATTRTSPVAFDVQNRTGEIVHISGRSANVNDKECSYELSPLTRWQIGSSGSLSTDADVPGKPVFGLHEAGRGTVELLGIGFESLTNTRTITAATLTIYHWNELASPSAVTLGGAVTAEDSYVDLAVAGPASVGSIIQLESEILRVSEVLNDATRYTVERGIHGSTPAAHAAATPVYHLQKKVFIVPFSRDFFGSAYSGNYSYPIYLPDVRIASAEMFVTNVRGDSETGTALFTLTTDRGLRTLSGGQFSIQVEGYLAIQSDVAPPVVVDASHSVRDVFAVVREAPAGGPIELRLRQDSSAYCTLTIPAGSNVSSTVHGFELAPLSSGASISLDILSVGLSSAGCPGKDLTVTIRL